MASLNLTPNATIIGIQTGIFLTTCFISKKLMLDPYLKIKKVREAKTQGSAEYATKMVEQNEQTAEKIKKTMAEAYQAMNTIKAEIKNTAENEKSNIIQIAMKQAAEESETLRSQIKESIQKEKDKIPEVISTLTTELYQTSLN